MQTLDDTTMTPSMITAAHAAINTILLSLDVGSSTHDVNDAVEKIHALRYPNGCPGGGCEFCVARLASTSAK